MPQRIIPWTYWECKPSFRGFSENFDKKIYFAELAEILTFSLSSISMSFDIATTFWHAGRAKFNLPCRILGLSFICSHLQSRIVEPVINFLPSCIIWIISHRFAFWWPSEKIAKSKMVDIMTSCNVLAGKETKKQEMRHFESRGLYERYRKSLQNVCVISVQECFSRFRLITNLPMTSFRNKASLK